MKKHILAAGVASVIGITGIGAGVAHAATTSSTEGPRASMVDAIASRFNLNKDEVEKVFDEQHEKMKSERDQQITDKVAQLVSDGKLTQTQADAINSKRAELAAQREANRDTLHDISADERKAKMEAQRTALEKWAEENNIADEYLRYVTGHGKGLGGPGMNRHMGDK